MLKLKPLGVQAREASVEVAVKEVVVEVVVPQYNKNLASRLEPESSSRSPESSSSPVSLNEGDNILHFMK